MPSPEIIKLARQLQSAAYQNGNIDAEDRWSDKRYREVADRSDAALTALLAAIDAASTGAGDSSHD
jgi:hypothetical protein